MTAARWASYAAALLLGTLTVFGFAPFALPGLPIVTLGGLFLLWHEAASARRAAALGFAFGLGLFGAGVSWLYIALNTFGGMAGWLAAIAMVFLCAYLALFPAFAGFACARLFAPGSTARLLSAAGWWAATEWLRGWLFSGFPWLSLGYSQVPSSPLVGYAPIGGVFLVSLALALTAACAVHAINSFAKNQMTNRWPLTAAAILWIGGFVLSTIDWTTPSPTPLSVALVQGNVAQDDKFDPAAQDDIMAMYASLTEASHAQLTVLPESALPMFADQVPTDYVERLRAVGERNRGAILLGLFFVQHDESNPEGDQYFNSVFSLGAHATELYRKHHLVPFGETIPLEPLVGWFIRRVLHIPLADQAAGPRDQRAFTVAGEKVAVNICYEDVFGAELISRIPEATLLVNVTNDAWYGRSIAAEQHNQIAALRAIESGRVMLRATNTGITSIIDSRGVERARLPWFTRGILTSDVRGRHGVTPYRYWGDALVVVLSLALVLSPFVRTK